MPETQTIESQLASFRELYAELCREADEDGERDDEELALIAIVDRKLDALEAMVRAQRAAGAGPEGDEEDAEAAWKKLSKSYQRLRRLHAGLERAGVDLAADLDVYLQAVAAHVAAEDWASAVNQTVLAVLWADERNLWTDYLDDEDDEDYDLDDDLSEEDAQSGRAAWEKLGGDALLADFMDMKGELRAQNSPHAAKFAEFCTDIEAAVEAEDWKAAVASAILLDRFISDNNLDPEEEEPTEAYPEKERWESWKSLRDKLTVLFEDLVEIEHPLASGLGSILDEIREAEEKTEYRRATKLLTEDALKFVDTHDLWEAVEPAGDEDDKTNLLPDLSKQMVVKLKALRRELDRADHKDARSFGALVDKIPDEVPDLGSLIPAARAIQDAWTFADDRGLWEFLGPLPKSEEEALFWEHNGDRYTRLQNLHRSLEAARQAFAPRLGECLTEIDDLLAADSFHLAGQKVDSTWELAKKQGMIDEGPHDIWRGLKQAVAALRALGSAARVQDALRDEGFAHADALDAWIRAMDAAEKASDWQEAVDQYEAAKAYADKHGLWDEVGVEPVGDDEDDESDEDDYPEKTRWESWQHFREKLRKLCEQLTGIEHPLADRLGAYLDEIDEAEKKQEYKRATDLLVDEAGRFVDDNDLWKAVDPGSGDDGNLLPSITRQQIAKLRSLSRELTRMDHEKAAEFAMLVDPIAEEVTDFSLVIPTGRQVEAAWSFADRHGLWSALPPLPKGEEERLFWEANGKLYRELNALQRRLEEAGHDEAVRFAEKLAEVDEAIAKDQFALASTYLDEAVELASKHDLWGDLPAGDEDGDPINPSTASISRSVGSGGRNAAEDVTTVQMLLNLRGASLAVDGICGPLTIKAIERFQKDTFGWKDGLISPDGKTFAALTGRISLDDIVKKTEEVASKVSGAVTDAAGTIVDSIGDAADSVGDFIGDFFGDGKDDGKKD